MTEYDFYGRLAEANVDEIFQNGRYAIQQEAEKNIPTDVIKKLSINKNDSFLDIGCGMGLNLAAISPLVKKSAACDHPNVIKRLKENGDIKNTTFYSGDFLTININEKYTKILSYSVLHALPNKKTVYNFIDKALSLLTSDGLMLLGDLANTDKKKRFLNSPRGKKFQAKWEKMMASSNDDKPIPSVPTESKKPVLMNDELVLNLLSYVRQKEFHAYLLDQPQSLPFGNTREDILIVGKDYQEKGEIEHA